MPEHLGRSKGNDEVIADGTSFFKKLKMPSMEDIVAARDENFFHGIRVGGGRVKSENG
jgi:hypothetical protein